MRYFIRITYDGSKFYGFQKQSDKLTVQGTLEKALTILNKKKVNVKGAGRTDVGVHALGQGVHFDLDVEIPCSRLQVALNRIVAPYIQVVKCKKVSLDFHARFSAIKKTYIYKIKKSHFSPLLYDYYYFYENHLDVEKIKKASSLFLGKHDFHNFVSGSRDNSNSEIFSFEIKDTEDELWFVLTGKSFYRYMVRNIVGALLDLNEGKCDLIFLKRMIEDSSFEGQLRTASARGLYLEKVDYEEEDSI